MKELTVDLNCDIGEIHENLEKDIAILDFISSANIACGFHAGSPYLMKKLVQAGIKKKISIGAHPGFQDREGFGRKNILLSPNEIYDLLIYQIGALNGFVKAEGGKLHHVKPHGALYNMAATDKVMATAISEAIIKIDSSLVLYGLAGSELITAGKKTGLKTASEVFADRTYQVNGTLTPRTQLNALIDDEQLVLERVIRMIQEGKVLSEQGVDISLDADTICIHGDAPQALSFVKLIHSALRKENILIGPTL
jgi:UPF0271 protein